MIGKFLLPIKYIKEEWKENIKNYKYSSNDYSLLYNYLTSPLCDKIVNYLPRYLA
jgi:hypothetical protein